MDCYHITGGKPLRGTYRLQSAKNSVLPIMAACILTEDVCVLRDCPELSDVETMIHILRELGCSVKWENGELVIDSSAMTGEKIPEHLGKKMRSSIFLMGPMLARFGTVSVCKPGGCAIGERPIDLHLSCLTQLGAEVEQLSDEVVCSGGKLSGAVVRLLYPSVGATENAMMAAVSAEGVTHIINGAREPEIVDLQGFLNACGAEIRGAGTGEIIIKGGKKLHGSVYQAIPDRIEAGTFLAAAAVTGGSIVLENARPQHLEAVCQVLRDMGCSVRSELERIELSAPQRLKAPARVETMPYPGFPTDLQSVFLSAASVAQGQSCFIETVFENRFKIAEELQRMGASLSLDRRIARVSGVPFLNAASVEARDLRGGAALVVAGLAAKGETIVKNICHIDRGYGKFDVALRSLGAEIERKKCDGG